MRALIILPVCLAAFCLCAPLRTSARGRAVLRVMTYNIHVGVGMDKKQDLARIAEVIKGERPDLVGLQEVDRGVERTGRVDEIRELARLTGMEYAFAHNLDYQGGQYGVAVLSRFPILSIDHRRYLNTREPQRRGFLRVVVEVKGRRVSFVTTHLDWQHEDGRLYEARQLLDALASVPGPLIVTGDFNEGSEGGAYQLMLKSGFADAWAQTRLGIAELPGDGATYPADKPSKRIDFVFYRVDGTMRSLGEAVRYTLASDHRPLSILFSL
jgi:endonuclease/exonuclease/phosphatase family metal-dependent hydrolase